VRPVWGKTLLSHSGWLCKHSSQGHCKRTSAFVCPMNKGAFLTHAGTTSHVPAGHTLVSQANTACSLGNAWPVLGASLSCLFKADATQHACRHACMRASLRHK
jgi:hypothetical protein